MTFGDISLEQAFELGQQAAQMCTDFLSKLRTDLGKPPVHKLQREKGFLPFLLGGKKRYAGRKTLEPGKPFVMSSSGMETVRRDNAKIASGTMEVCLDNIIMNHDYDATESIAYVHQILRDLLTGKTPMSQLIISKGLSKSKQHYEDSAMRQVHSELAKRIEARSHVTGEEPYHTGDRVKFVMVQGASKSKAFERSEDPLYALRNRIPIDVEYYIQNQMVKPLLRIFNPLIDPSTPLKKYNAKGEKVPLTQKEIESLKTYKVLFTGPHMETRVQKLPQSKGIMKFAKRQKRCLGCRCSMSEQVGATCTHCDGQSIQEQLQSQKANLEQLQAKCLQTCRDCVGDQTATHIPCANNDCDNFYMREKVVVDIEDLMEKLNLF